ncbi:MAG: hypothetical protein BA867_02845 [Desulfobacterales bacterium S5133MH16]|nr:MAG: hypothetical protein BA867_02845 [Desulfobacterales bacterium S5133MH16]
MDEQQYIEERIDNQIKWYSNKSQWNQTWYKRLRALEILAASTIPLLTGYLTEVFTLRYVIGILSVIIAVISGILTLYKFQENWTEYRTTCESLKHEKFLYLTKTEVYDADNSFTLLVQRVEALISKEHTKWSQYIKAPEKHNGLSGGGSKSV